jgi:hypothetical protein
MLSQTLAIDELSALRLIILDYENKSETELINCSSSGTINEMENGIDSVFGNGDEAPLKASETQSDTEKEQKLLFRRIGLYFLERRYVLRCAQHLVSAALEEDEASNIWSSLGKRVLEEILEKDGGVASAGRIIDGLRQRTTGKRSECPGWVSDYKETIGEEVLFEWERQVRYRNHWRGDPPNWLLGNVGSYPLDTITVCLVLQAHKSHPGSSYKVVPAHERNGVHVLGHEG